MRVKDETFTDAVSCFLLLSLFLPLTHLLTLFLSFSPLRELFWLRSSSEGTEAVN